MTQDEETRAIEEIKRLKARYFRCMDTKDWGGYLAVFAPDADIDSSQAYTPRDFSGAAIMMDGVAPPTPNAAWHFTNAKAFVDDLSRTLEGVSTVHHGHMPEIELTSPTTAKGIWAMEDMLRWPRGSAIREMHGYGHYVETYVRLAEGWRIKTLKLTRVRVDTSS
jgi:hypothetical protein